MSFRFRSSAVGLVLLAWSLGATPASADVITQHFPADKPKDKMQTRWRIVWDIERHANGAEVLVIKAAYFQRAPEEKEIKILGDCRIAEIFVPYYEGTRIYDISAHNFRMVNLGKEALGPACVTPGQIYSRSGDEAKTGPVIKEVHDDHARWMNAREKLRRGQIMDIWSVLNGANYRYIMSYQFRDDGAMCFRLGATAHNLHRYKTDRATHIHVGFWRLNFALGSATQTQVSVVENDQKKFKTTVKPLPWETSLKWDPEKFTRLRVESLVEKNNHKPASPIAYDIVPVRTGSPRFYGVGEEFTHNDFWVTTRRLNDLRPRDLPLYLKEEPLKGKGVTIWHMSPALHNARDEDFGDTDTGDGMSDPGKGVALTAWATFEMKPRNLFGKTPLYP